MLHKYFDKAFIINLDRRPDRIENATKRCQSIGLEFERFAACDGKAENLQIPTAREIGQAECYWNLGAAGMCQSLIRLFNKAKEDGLRSILIMEDDVEFHPQINQAVASWIKDVPEDWETLYFGANHFRPQINITPNIVRLTGSYALHCHAVKETVYDLLIDELSKMRNPADVVYTNLIQSRGKSYCFKPNLAYQAADYSDIMDRPVNYTFLRS